jgi:coiled-coil domain-containing protein 61
MEVASHENYCRWKGIFQAKFIEEITHRTGNYKPFTVFVKMLISAFDSDSGAVSLDLLTGEDLDALRQANGLGAKAGPNQASVPLAKSKRYLILTYQGEFDKVHYPMALSYCDQEDTNELKRTIVRLRDELDSVRKSQVDSKSLREVEVLVMSYKSEKDKLARELTESQAEITRLNAEIASLQSDNHLLRTKVDVLQSQISTQSLPRGAVRPVSGSSSVGRPPIRSRGSSIASSPASSLRNSPLRDRNGSRASSPQRRPSPKGPSPYRQTLSKRSPAGRDISPYRPRPPLYQKQTSSPKRGMSGGLRLPLPSVGGSYDRDEIRIEQQPPPPPPVALSEVDARLQALQNFLRHQKATAARG